MPQPSRPSVTDLASLLLAQAERLQVTAPHVAGELRKHASQITNPASFKEGLVEFARFAEHHKGLTDVLIPGQRTDEWASFVRTTRRLSRRALREHSLDQL